MRRILLITVCCLTLFSFVSCEEFTDNTEKSNVYIISVGIDYFDIATKKSVDIYSTSFSDISRFEYCTSQRINPLDCCPEDAKDISNCFSQIYEAKNIQSQAFLMTSESSDNLRPTVQNLKKVIDGIKVNKDDLIIFYYSGHGVYQEINSVKQSCFCMASDGIHDLVFLPVKDVLSALSDKGCHIFAVLDDCETGSGYFSDSSISINDLFDTLTKELKFSNVSIIASSGQTQISSAGTVNSAYTSAFLKALGWNTDSDTLEAVPSFMTSRELFRKSTVNWKSRFQTPEINYNQLELVVVPE